MKLSHISIAIALAAPLSAQRVTELRFTEVLVDPVGANAGNQVLEVENHGNTIVDLFGWYLAAHPSTYALPDVQIPYFGRARIHLGVAGNNSPADIYLPQARVLGASETLVLFKRDKFDDPANVVDFVSWGGGKGYIDVAVRANQWPSTLDTLTFPIKEGHSFAHFGLHSWGNGSEPRDWYDDGTPTLGSPNDPGSLFNVYNNCKGKGPGITGDEQRGRPWLGEVAELELHSLPDAPSVAVMVFGLRTVTPIPLTGLGIPCNWSIQCDGAMFVRTNAGLGTLAYRVPNDSAFIGLELYWQGIVPHASYTNPFKTMVTNTVVTTFGSR